jgi:hypothetical protein
MPSETSIQDKEVLSPSYCEDELPSRIDFGKNKYGRPFTTE